MEVLKQHRTVMLVEDLDDDAFFFERAFATAAVDAQLLRFTDGKDAVSYLEHAASTGLLRTHDHLMFLDLKLPVMNGFDVLQWVRDRGLSVEIVVLSGSDLDFDVALARRLGAADYLVKPISSADLRKRVMQVANAHER